MRILSFNISHDSSVCCYNDGNIEFFCKEERLSRVKRDNIPFMSLNTFFEFNGDKKIDKIMYLTPSDCEPYIESIFKGIIKKYSDVEMENYSSMTHHLCHASLAFYNSGFEECLVFVIDRNGSIFFNGNDRNDRLGRESESVYICNYNDILIPIYKTFWTYPKYQNKKYEFESLLRKNLLPNIHMLIHNSCGIVKAYEAATMLIGQNPLDAGKTMGLSSYGDDSETEDLFSNGSPKHDLFSSLGEDSESFDSLSCFSGYETLINPNITKQNYQLYANKAKQIQIQSQEEVCKLIKKYVSLTGIKNVCLVGGYGLNVVANNYYICNNPDVNFYFEPVADDTGIPIGAAMLEYHMQTGNIENKKISNNFYHFYKEETIDNGEYFTVEQLCDLLISQKSIAIFDGNPESGPRALGHRSILFDARNPDCKDIVNRIKKREWYRPFAGIILEEKFSEYFDTCGLKSSEYMTINFSCLDGVEKIVPGVIHVDNTCRVQTVSESNQFLYTLLNSFYKKTNCPILLNTSFNLAGEPLVQTKKDAIKTLFNSDLDAVYFVDQKKIFFNT